MSDFAADDGADEIKESFSIGDGRRYYRTCRVRLPSLLNLPERMRNLGGEGAMAGRTSSKSKRMKVMGGEGDQQTKLVVTVSLIESVSASPAAYCSPASPAKDGTTVGM